MAWEQAHLNRQPSSTTLPRISVKHDVVLRRVQDKFANEAEYLQMIASLRNSISVFLGLSQQITG